MKNGFFIAALVFMTSCAPSTQQLYYKTGGTQTLYNKDHYECARADTYRADVTVQGDGNASAVAGGFLQGYANANRQLNSFKSCLESRGYKQKEVSAEESDKAINSLAAYSKERMKKEGK